MSRLFVFGCSFTSYIWHTYADLFAENFFIKQNKKFDINNPNSNIAYQNWGYPGLGNQAIAERVMECHLKNNLNPTDLIIVQWSGHLRKDYAMFKKDNDNEIIWKTAGSVFSENNISVFGKDYIINCIDETALYLHTLHNIAMVQNLLNNIGCKWLMTSMSDLQNIELDHETKTSNTNSFLAHWPKYKKILENENWLPPLLNFKKENPEQDWWWEENKKFHLWEYFRGKKTPVFEKKNNMWNDGHLSPEQNLLYVENILDKMQYNKEIPDAQLSLMQKYYDMKQSCENNFDTFCMLSANLINIKRKYGF